MQGGFQTLRLLFLMKSSHQMVLRSFCLLGTQRQCSTAILVKVKSAVAKMLFFPSLGYNLFLNMLGKRQWYTPVDEHVLLGALPLWHVVPQLLADEKITRVVSMNKDSELRWAFGPDQWNELGIKFFQLPTIDIFDVPSLQQIVDGVNFLSDCRSKGERVYVHCKSGRVRSATLVAAYLMKTYGMSVEEAKIEVTLKRPFVIFKRSQTKLLEEYRDLIDQKEKKSGQA